MKYLNVPPFISLEKNIYINYFPSLDGGIASNTVAKWTSHTYMFVTSMPRGSLMHLNIH